MNEELMKLKLRKEFSKLTIKDCTKENKKKNSVTVTDIPILTLTIQNIG